jgi:hypothetical protein
MIVSGIRPETGRSFLMITKVRRTDRDAQRVPEPIRCVSVAVPVLQVQQAERLVEVFEVVDCAQR